MAKFDLNQFEDAEPVTTAPAAPPKSQGFDLNQFEDAEPESEGVVSSILHGVEKVAKKYDSYAGAPVRAGIGALQDDKGIMGAASAFKEQWGEDPDKAPTGQGIAKKAGISDKGLGFTSTLMMNPAMAPIVAGAYLTGGKEGVAKLHEKLGNMSAADIAGFGVDVGADLTNIIPVGAIIKGGTKLGIKGADAALKAGKRSATATAETITKLGRKGLSASTGADEAAMIKYWNEHNELKDIVDTRSEVGVTKRDMDATLQPLSDNVDAAQELVEKAKESRSEELSRLADSKLDAKERFKLAEEQRMGETGARVAGDVKRLNKEVSTGSEKAFQILDTEGVRVPIVPLKADLTKGIKALEASAVTDEQVAVVDLLKRYRERLDKFGTEIPGGEAKRLIQSLDREMKYLAPGEVGRMARDDQVLGVLRRRIDEPLKASPEYAKQMEGVAKDTRLLMGADDMATESGAVRALQAAQKVSGKDRAEILRLLGERQGTDYLAAVDRATLPEYQKLAGLLRRYRAARRGSELKAAQLELDNAVDRLAPFKSIAPNKHGKSGTEALILNQMRPTPGMNQENLVANLDKTFGKNFARQIEKIKTIAAFDKEFTRGSANTKFWAFIMAAIGGIIGGPAGLIGGGAIGAAFGRLVIDKFGPQTARVILDSLKTIDKLPPVEWVRQLKVPDSVKSELLKELAEASAKPVRGAAAASKPLRDVGRDSIKAADQDLKGEDKWASDGAQKLGLTEEQTKLLAASPRGKKLLIEASDLPKDSKAMMRVMEEIRKGWGQNDSFTGNEIQGVRQQRRSPGGR